MNLDHLRACSAHAKLCGAFLYTTQVTVRVRQWSGRHVGEGTATDTDYRLPKLYPVRQLSSREVSARGGTTTEQMVKFEDITPPYEAMGGGGHPAEKLAPKFTSAPGDLRDRELIYVLEGDVSGEFSLQELDTTNPLGWSLTLRRNRSTP